MSARRHLVPGGQPRPVHRATPFAVDRTYDSSILADYRTGLNKDSNYPGCEQYFGAGYCCVAYQQGCYIDISDTSCDAAGSVACSDIAPGTKEACCLPNTTCAKGYTASSTYARCNIQQSILQAIANPSTSSSSSSTASSTSSLSSIVSTSTTNNTAPLATPVTGAGSAALASSSPSATAPGANTVTPLPGTGVSTSLTAGTIAGIAIAPVVAVVLILLAAFFIWRKRSRSKDQRPQGNGNAAPSYYDLYSQPATDAARTFYTPASAVSMQEKAELAAGQMDAKELHSDALKHTHLSVQQVPAELEATMRR